MGSRGADGGVCTDDGVHVDGGGHTDEGVCECGTFLTENVFDVASFPCQILPHMETVHLLNATLKPYTPSPPGA